ncbi:ribosome biogenesis GTP-binding protein YihA/YsxC [Thermovibrio sp.]
MKIKKVELYKTVYTPSDIPQTPYNQVAFVGRSNVGKSSLLNALANNFKLAKVSSKPGKTRSINFYLVNNKFFLVDLPGYGFAKLPLSEKKRWQELIESYLKDNDRLKGIFLLVDSKVGPTEKDIQMKDWLEFYSIPYVVVATKVDKLKRKERSSLEERIKKALGNTSIKVIPFSSKTREGRDRLLKELSLILES